jgi:hypothetical protein
MNWKFILVFLILNFVIGFAKIEKLSFDTGNTPLINAKILSKIKQNLGKVSIAKINELEKINSRYLQDIYATRAFINGKSIQKHSTVLQTKPQKPIQKEDNTNDIRLDRIINNLQKIHSNLPNKETKKPSEII